MVCYAVPQPTVTRAIDKLRKKLASGEVKLTIGRNGAVAFTNWADADREGVGDTCAFRKLQRAGSVELRRAVAEAERRCGRKLNASVVASGVHSHDGGRTWGPGH